MDLRNFNDKKLIKLYSDIISELKSRKVIRSKNIIGDLGEHLAVEHYNNTAGLPKLTIAKPSAKNIDARSRNGDRYTIKSTSGKLTGVFFGLKDKDSEEENPAIFEFVVIVKFKDNFVLDSIIEIDWKTFLKHKRWHKTMRGWNLSVTKELVRDSKIRYNHRKGLF